MVLMCATTVGIDIGVRFGKVFVHTCCTAGVVRDLFQLTVRIGRFDGGLTDKTMYHVVIQDSSPQKKEAQRKSCASKRAALSHSGLPHHTPGPGGIASTGPQTVLQYLTLFVTTVMRP